MTRVLVVDDEPTYCWALRRLLSMEGFEVETASDGRQAMELAAETAPDVLVVDWMLKGGLNGIDVSENLRQANPRLRVVAITGHPSGEREFVNSGVRPVTVLTKPFKSADLLAAVRDALAE